MFGKTYPLKRLQYGLGDNGIKSHSYSNIDINLNTWTPCIESIKDRIIRESHLYLDSCLINYYRTGEDYIAEHSDRENKGIGNVVFTVSLGASRKFRMYGIINKAIINDTLIDKKTMVVDTILNEGDIVMMFGNRIQKEYTHTVPIEKKVKDGRYSLTFRLLYPDMIYKEGIKINETSYDFSESKFKI